MRCEDQLLPIQQNTVLFGLLGITYDGNGITTFGLPDFRGHAIFGASSNNPLGQKQVQKQ